MYSHAGRPKGRKHIKISITVRQDQAIFLREQKNKSKLMRCLIDYVMEPTKLSPKVKQLGELTIERARLCEKRKQSRDKREMEKLSVKIALIDKNIFPISLDGWKV